MAVSEYEVENLFIERCRLRLHEPSDIMALSQ